MTWWKVNCLRGLITSMRAGLIPKVQALFFCFHIYIGREVFTCFESPVFEFKRRQQFGTPPPPLELSLFDNVYLYTRAYRTRQLSLAIVFVLEKKHFGYYLKCEG